MADMLSADEKYVVGFGFTVDGSQVVLMKMERPAKFKGQLNGSGGQYEADKDRDLYDTVRREFEEECSVVTKSEEWHLLQEIGNTSVFYAFSDAFKNAKTMTDEEVFVLNVGDAVITEKAVSDVPDIIKNILAKKPH